MTTLTDRYIDATLRSIPKRQRADLELELRASIADALDDRPEVEVLASLGHPSRLAASYADRPLQLIGPSVYLDYVRVLGILLSSIVPLLFVAVGISAFLGGESFAGALGSAANAALLIAMHIAIWTTLVFTVIDRTFARLGRKVGEWDPATLPELPAKRIDVAAIVGGSSVTALIAAALIIVQSVNPVGLIEPELWDSGALLLVVIFAAASIALDVVGYYLGWGIPQAFSNALLSALFVAVVVGVSLRGELLSTAFFESVGWPAGAGPNGVVTWVIIVLIVLMSIGNVIGGFTRARAARARA